MDIVPSRRRMHFIFIPCAAAVIGFSGYLGTAEKPKITKFQALKKATLFMRLKKKGKLKKKGTKSMLVFLVKLKGLM